MPFLKLLAGAREQNIRELSAVRLRRPQLELVHFGIGHHAAIQRETIAFIRDILQPISRQKSRKASRKICNVVRRCWPSMTCLFSTCVVGVCFWSKNHRTQKVYGSVLPANEVLTELPRDVLPERLPLMMQTPDILTLKQRHF